MRLSQPAATVTIPDGIPEDRALGRITHLAVGAHQDDCEIMALHGVLTCYHRSDLWFGAITCTNGSGSPRQGIYASCTDEEMARLRRREQEKAAVVGDYGALVQLNHPSPAVKDVRRPELAGDLDEILRLCRPRVVYTHNPADKHETHLAVGLAAVRALRRLPPGRRPEAVFGCEVWRNLDWLADKDKVALDVAGHEGLAAALIGVYDSQVSGGKRYDLATLGRLRSNATYFDSHATDRTESLWFAMDLTPLVRDDRLDVVDFVLGHVDGFRRDVEAKLRAYTP